jgi:hypothetical protein
MRRASVRSGSPGRTPSTRRWHARSASARHCGTWGSSTSARRRGTSRCASGRRRRATSATGCVPKPESPPRARGPRARLQPLPVDGAVRRLAGLGLRRLRWPAVQLRGAELRADAARPAARLARGQAGDAVLDRPAHLGAAARLGHRRRAVRLRLRPHRPLRTLMLTMLLYAVGTAACAFAHQHLDGCWCSAWWPALGIGGEWAAGASMVAEVVPESKRVSRRARCSTPPRPWACSSPPSSTCRWPATGLPTEPEQSWRYVFLFGLLPAAAAFAVRLFVREPERWKNVAEATRASASCSARNCATRHAVGHVPDGAGGAADLVELQCLHPGGGHGGLARTAAEGRGLGERRDCC